MKQCPIPQAGIAVSRIGYGCANLAGWDRAGPDAGQVRRARAAIEAALEQGITLFDHADIYGFGHAEALFGALLRDAPGLRERIVIQTKCGQRLPDGWAPGRPIEVDLGHAHIVRSAEASLKRLGIERIDLLLLHTPSPLAEPDEIARAFDALHASGKVGHFGVSNHEAGQIALLAARLDRPIAVNQIRLGLAHPHAMLDGMRFPLELATGGAGGGPAGSRMAGTLDHCRRHGIQVQAWSPLRGDLLLPAGGNGSPLATALHRVAAELGATPGAVALAWLLRHPAGIVPILGSTDPAHIAANCAADALALPDADWFALFAAAGAAPDPD